MLSGSLSTETKSAEEFIVMKEHFASSAAEPAEIVGAISANSSCSCQLEQCSKVFVTVTATAIVAAAAVAH